MRPAYMDEQKFEDLAFMNTTLSQPLKLVLLSIGQDMKDASFT